MKYLVQIKDEVKGPYSIEELNDINEVSSESLVWNDSLENWTPLGNIRTPKDDQLNLKRPKTGRENNLLIQEFLKSIKKYEFQKNVLIFCGALIILYGILFYILMMYAESGGTNEYAIYNHGKGFEGMFLKNTIIYLIILLAITIIGLKFYIYNSPKLNLIIGNEKFNPKIYLGKWVERRKSTSCSISLYQTGELNLDGNEKKYKAFWWYVNGKIYELNTIKNKLYVHTIHFTNGSYSILFDEYNFVKS